MLGGLSFAEYHFGKSCPDRTVMIDLGETQVLIGQVPQDLQHAVHTLVTIAQSFQVLADIK